MYREAGADVLFIEALTSEAEAEAAVQALPGVPLLSNWAEGGKTPPISLDRVKDLGYRDGPSLIAAAERRKAAVAD